MYTAGMTLTADDGRLLTKALELAAKQLKAERGDQGPENTREQLLADALMVLASSFLATGREQASGSDDYRAVVFTDEAVVNPDHPEHRGDCDDCGRRREVRRR